MDQALQLFGPVTHVHAELERRRNGAEVDEDTFVALRHASGVLTHLWMSELAAQAGPRFRVLGSESAYTKFGMDPQEARLRAGELPDADWGVEPESAWGVLGHGDDIQRVPTERGDYRAFYRRLRDALRGDGPLPVDPMDAVAVLEIIEAARDAATGDDAA